MSAIVHVEIPVDDIERARKFYSTIFGWDIKEVPGMNYWLFMPAQKEVGGGMMKRMAPGQGILVYIGVSSVEESSGRVQALGGKVVVPKQPVPGIGWFAVCLDTEGNSFALWEEDKGAG